MKAIILNQKVARKVDDLEIPTRQIDLQSEQEELIIDCPDCFDSMIKIYDSEDKLEYQCENCGLTVSKSCYENEDPCTFLLAT